MLGEPQAVDPEVARTLSRDEVQRSRSFRYERDRRRYVQRRTILRMILGQYLSAPAATIRFTYGPNGKPALDVEDDAGLRFSLASSGEVALYAVTRARRVGVDVEALRPLIDLAGLIARFCTPREASHMAGLAAEERERAAFAVWTRKEAYVKALGEGLSLAPNQVDVSPGADLGAWTIETMAPLPGYVGAVAAEGDDWRVRRLEWAPSRTVPA